MTQDTLKVSNDSQRQLDAVTVSARNAIQTHYSDPAALLDFIQRHNTSVHCFPSSLKWFLHLFLGLLGFEQGFIVPVDHFRYRILKTFLRIAHLKSPTLASLPSQSTDDKHGLFILTTCQLKVGFLSHQLYHWLAFRTGVQGYSPRSKRLYRQFWFVHHGQLDAAICNTMNSQDMVSLKAAINREMEALKFLRDILHEVLVPADQARQLTLGSTSA